MKKLNPEATKTRRNPNQNFFFAPSSRRGLFLLLFLIAASASAQEIIPPRPTQYVTDTAHVLSSTTVDQLNHQLANFDDSTSNQILVAIYPKMQSDSSIDDYTLRIANKWQAGQKKKDNGAILFVFVQDHKMFIQVGYGLEGALPDALCKRIIDQEIAPRFKQRDFDGGITAGVQAMMSATRGEYKGNGPRHQSNNSLPAPWVIFLILFIIFAIISKIRRYSAYGPTGIRRSWYMGPGYFGGWGGGGFSGGGGGGFSGGGGGFSGGGGSFGGGGAGGSW